MADWTGPDTLPSRLIASLRKASADFTAEELAALYELPLAEVLRALDRDFSERRRLAKRRLRRAAERARERAAVARRREARAAWVSEVRELRAAGWTLAAIGRKVGRTKSTIHLLCQGLPGPIEPARADDAPESIRPGESDPPPAIADDVPPRLPAGDLGASRTLAVPAPAPSAPAFGSFHDAPAIGSGHGRAKLTESQCAELRELRASDPKRWTHRELAKRFGLSRSNVFNILSGVTWRHVPMAESPGR